MRIFVAAVMALGVVANHGAFAAHTLAKVHAKQPAPVASVYNWSGFYGGVNAGAAWGSYDPQTLTAPKQFGAFGYGFFPSIGNWPQAINPTGFSGGGQIGYNWQFGRFVVGVESDLNYFHLNGAASSGAVNYPPGTRFDPHGQFVISSYAHSDWLLTLRPRAGVAMNNWLFYATGGLALTDLEGDFLFTDSNGARQSAAIDSNKFGYTLGAGVEWGVSDRWSMKAEYLYVNFDRTVARQTTSNNSTQIFTQSEALTANIVRLGLNYRFSASGPLSSGGNPR